MLTNIYKLLFIKYHKSFQFDPEVIYDEIGLPNS